jgi:hypothetical protein
MAVDWVAAIAASVAAVASVAVLWHELRSVAWEIQSSGDRNVRDQVVNVGRGTARDVRLRVGSTSDPTHSDGQETRRPTVGPGEAFSFSNHATYGDPEDYAVNITWRGLWRRKSWSRPLI